MFFCLKNCERYLKWFNEEASEGVSYEDVEELIEGIGSDEAVYMVSRIFNEVDINSVEGLYPFLQKLEGHPSFR